MPSLKNLYRNLRPRTLLVALAVAAAGYLLLRLWLPADKGPHLLTAPVTTTDIEETVLATGTLEAFKQVSVGAQASGQVKSLKVVLGQTVSKGQLIAEIDSLTQQNALRTAAAALENYMAQSRAKEAVLRQAELAFARQRQMQEQDAGTRADFESAQATLESTRAEIAALQAQIKQAQISVDTAKINQEYTRITAPMDGVVVAIVTQEGQTVNANQSTPTIIKLARLDTMTVKAQISEADVTRVKAGQDVYFTILGEPNQRYYAKLRAVEPAPDSIASESTSTSSTSTTSSSSSSTAVYYNGLLDVPNPAGKLRISMTTEVNIVLGKAKAALTIPSTALSHPEPGGRYIVRVASGPEQHIQPRKVVIGLNNKVSAQVLEGLREGEQVVIGEASAKPTATTSGSRPPPPMM